MANGTIDMHYNDAWLGYISYSTTTNTSTNSSEVTASIYMRKNDGYSTGGNGAWAYSITIGEDDTQYYSTANGFTLYQDFVCIGSRTKTVYHDSDGSGSVYIAAAVDGPAGTSLSGKTLSGKGTVQLDTIARTSSITTVKSVVLGNACSITWVPSSASYHYKIKFSLGGWSYTTSVISPGTTSSYTYSDYKIPIDVASQIPNATTGSGIILLYTYTTSSCTTQVGSAVSSTFTVTVPDSVVPTIGSCAVEIVNSNATVNGWGIAVAGYSKVKISANATGAYGSTISSFSISGSYTATVTSVSEGEMTYTGASISTSGNKKFLITCKDSRGRVSGTYESDIIQFFPYTKPFINKFSIIKNEDRTKMVALVDYEYCDIGNNSATATMYYKASTSEDWTTYGVLDNAQSTTLDSLNLSDTKSYNFRVVVTDALDNSEQKDAFSSTVEVLLDFQAGGKGLGVGKVCEIDNLSRGTSSMEVSMDAYFYGGVYIGGNSEDKSLDAYIKNAVDYDSLATQDYVSEQLNTVNNTVDSLSASVSSVSDRLDGKTEFVLRWENESRGGAFGAKSVTVDLSDSNYYGVIFTVSNNTDYTLPMAIFKKGTPGRYRSHDGVFTQRGISSSTNSSVTFENAMYWETYGGSPVSSDELLIPYCIFAIKGV